MDISGETQRDVTHNVVRTRLDRNGVPLPEARITQLESEIVKQNAPMADGYCGSCYGGQEPEGGCCNSCEAVREAYVNRGWSFSNPDSIEQVRNAGLCLMASSLTRISLVPTRTLGRKAA
jgi:endoplasmic reticulum-Golgi intermediate compartment protein 3